MSQLALIDSAGRPTLAAAFVARDEAMERVLQHAEEIHDDWRRVAYKFAVAYARTHQQFIWQDVVRAFKDAGYEQPHTDRAWGPVTTFALRVGVVVKHGVDSAPHRHASACWAYRSMIFKGAA